MHTPPPWKCVGQSSTYWDIAGNPVDGMCTPIGRIRKTGNDESNLNLVLVSGELLEACEAAMRIVHLWEPSEDAGDKDSDHFNENMLLSIMKQRFEQAIRKARAGQ